MTTSQRAAQIVLIAATLVVSWLGMQVVHELGHVLAAKATGAKIVRVELHPLAFSQTILESHPRPTTIVWMGPVFGVIAPIMLWLAADAYRLPGAFVVRFFAGFCAVANGAYVGCGSFYAVGDCSELLGQDVAIWQLWLFGIVTIPTGFWLWNGQGSNFGIGKVAIPVDGQTAAGTSIVAAALVIFELTLAT